MTAELGPVPARALPASARAPGKCILFGEHAVVHGAPALILALDLHTQVVVTRPSAGAAAGPAPVADNPYLAAALTLAGRGPTDLEVRAVSRVPRAAGLGSSAAFVAALSAVLSADAGGLDRPGLAQRAFAVERAAQGVGSPGDTSASVAGGYITVNGPATTGPRLWEVRAGSERWDVRRAPDPGWSWVVAYSGIPRSTAEAVRAVGERLGRPDGPALLQRFADVAARGIAAVAAGDRGATGRLLTENQSLLRDAGVSHPRLEALIEAAAPASEGAKLTGAGRGGSIVALPVPGREVDLMRRLARAGAVPFPVTPAAGAALVEPAFG